MPTRCPMALRHEHTSVRRFLRLRPLNFFSLLYAAKLFRIYQTKQLSRVGEVIAAKQNAYEIQRHYMLFVWWFACVVALVFRRSRSRWRCGC